MPEDPRPDAELAPGSDSVLPRRDFLRIAGGVGAGALLGGALPALAAESPVLNARGAPARSRQGDRASHVVVVGAGIWGSSTAVELCKRGATVTLVDAYGPGNSRCTSGDETRGIRSSYGDRGVSGELWTAWARRAIAHWKEFDAEHGKEFGTRFFFETGDIIMRTKDEPFLERTREYWTKQNVKFELLDGDEIRKRWPVFAADDITIGIYEPDAGVARARYSTQAKAVLATRLGAKLVIGRAKLGPMSNGKLQHIELQDGTRVTGDAYVFACGPWLPKLFPELLGTRMRIPLGTACYYGTPVNDPRYTFPNIPSYNFPGVTGWAALPVDNRGFRVRGAVAPPPPPADAIKEKLPEPPPRPPADPMQADPDTSTRWPDADRIAGSRRFLEQRIPGLADAPLLETRSCHYESSINRNFIIDRLPEAGNAWIAGVGQAEGFKFAPIAADYTAMRVLGDEGDPELVKAFKLPTDEYSSATNREDDE